MDDFRTFTLRNHVHPFAVREVTGAVALIGLRTEALSEPSYALRFSRDETRIVTLEGTRRLAFDQYRRA